MSMFSLPGLIDCHVHFREPGLTHKEDFSTGAAAALAGGITTVCDMPNTQPPTCTLAALQDKHRRVERLRNPKPDIRFFFGVTEEEHLKELQKVNNEDICGVKLYMDHSTGNQKVDSAVLENVFYACASRDLPVVVHAEDPEINAAAAKANTRTDVAAHSFIRPPESEVAAVRRAIDVAETFKTRLHIAHLSTDGALRHVRKAKRDGVPVTCEVTPHHLFLTIDDYEVLGTLAKMNPPLRTHDHCEALWEGILDGTVDCIASDHAPHTLEEKRSGPPLQAPSGVPGVETMVPLLLSCVFADGPKDQHGASRLPTHNSQLTIEGIRRLLFDNPNRIFSLGRNPDAPPWIQINPQREWVIEGKKMKSKCGWTPYEGWKVRGDISWLL